MNFTWACNERKDPLNKTKNIKSQLNVSGTWESYVTLLEHFKPTTNNKCHNLN
jgi:hypothetical protein